jgi:hypothetical protein
MSALASISPVWSGMVRWRARLCRLSFSSRDHTHICGHIYTLTYGGALHFSGAFLTLALVHVHVGYACWLSVHLPLNAHRRSFAPPFALLRCPRLRAGVLLAFGSPVLCVSAVLCSALVCACS